MTYLVFDSETQIHKTRKRTANPFDDRNYVVMRGWKKQGDPYCSSEYFESHTQDNYLRIDPDVDVLVGFNIKFDLLYEMVQENPYLRNFYKRGGRIWCCQYAEYLLRAQDRKYHMCSLDQIIEDYGGRKKVDGIKELWEAGVQTSAIDPALLQDYLIGTVEEGRNSGDIGNTELIYLGQLEAAEKLGMTNMIRARMDGLAATTEMEFNGIHVDVKTAREDLGKLAVEQKQAEADLHQYIAHIPEEVGFSWTSRIHTSCLIFGGRIKYSKQDTYIDEATGQLARLVRHDDWPLFNGNPVDPSKCTWSDSQQCFAGQRSDGVWVAQDRFLSGKKKGQPKYKKVKGWGELKVKYQDFFYDLPGYTEPKPEWKTANVDGAGNPVYSTGVDVMDIITKRDIPFLKAMGRYQSLNKEIGTYYVTVDEKTGEKKGMLTCLGPDHIVHHMLNHNTTVTTRLASTTPNMQNIPRGDKSRVKAMFTSRFENGVMGELDYSQLEVVVQGMLSGDKNLIRDLINKIDFHCKRVSAKYGCTYEEALVWCKDEILSPDFPLWKKRRTGVKEFSFQRAYGAGADAISDSTGLDVETVKELIAAEEKMYPGITKFNEQVEQAVLASAEYFRDGERGWRPFRKGYWQAPTGTMYSWRSWDAPKFLRDQGIMDSFSPPELKNYPVQGTGGEIVQLIIGVLWRWFMLNDNFGGKAFLVNTVHDCVWVDMHPDVVDIVIPGMKRIMEAVPQLLKKNFGIDCPVPFPVEAETGVNMLDLHHYH